VIGRRDTLGTSTEAQACAFVRYELRAYLYAGDRVISSCQTDVRIHNTVTQCPPPVPSDDFPGEYTCSLARSLRSKKMAYLGARAWNNTQQLSISVIEPAVVRLDPSRAPQDSVTIALGVRFCLASCQDADKHEGLRPDTMELKLDWALRSTTFVSVVPLQAAPTRKQSITSPVIVSTAKLSAKHAAKTTFSDWGRTGDFPRTADGPQCRLHWTAGQKYSRWFKDEDLHILVPLPSDRSPTFFTPHLIRRYSLQLKLDCRIHGTAATSFKFEVPIQIIWIQGTKGMTGVEDVGRSPVSRNSSVTCGGGNTRGCNQHIRFGPASPLYVK